MKISLVVLCLTSLLALDTQAATPPKPAVAPPRKSTFDANKARNPFWPIGWKKPDAQSGDAPAAPALSPASFALTSVTTGGGTARFAILNGKIVQEGQEFGLQMGTQIYRVKVQSVEDGQVVLAYEGGQVVVPLRRH